MKEITRKVSRPREMGAGLQGSKSQAYVHERLKVVATVVATTLRVVIVWSSGYSKCKSNHAHISRTQRNKRS